MDSLNNGMDSVGGHKMSLSESHWSCCPLHRMPFCDFVHMLPHGLVLRPRITAFGLGARVAHVILLPRQRIMCNAIDTA